MAGSGGDGRLTPWGASPMWSAARAVKWRNLQGNPRLSLVVDDLVSTRP
ncbi:hypothetical protein ACFWAR_12090 [Streptomyces sp. NPDC059917]